MNPAWLGFLTVAVFLVLVLSNRVSVLAALILVPVVAAVLGGHAPKLGEMMAEGAVRVAPVAIMITFAILYFGLMLDLGLFAPLVKGLVALIGSDPLRLCLVTALLPMLVALDGDGSTTFLISITALLPVHRALRMEPLVLPGIVGLSAGVMNMLPWGGPTARAMAVLHADVSQMFRPVIVPMAAGVLWVFGVALWLGWRERTRLAAQGPDPSTLAVAPPAEDSAASTPISVSSRMFGFNASLTVVLLVALFRGTWPLHALFITALAVALVVNCRSWDEQRARLQSHASSVVLVTAMVFAGGIFSGILMGSGMIDAMARTCANALPPSLAGGFSTIVAVTSVPLSLVFTPDAYYFGVLPVLSATAANAGQDGLAVGRAALLGQMTTGFPLSPLTASTFILVGLSGVSLADHQRFLFKWALGTTLVMTIVARLTGAI